MADAWKGELQEFAAKLAAIVPPHARIDMAVSNISSLAPDDAASIQTSLVPLLATHGLRLSGSEPATVSVQVTISQNADGFLLVAQVKRDGDEKVTMVGVPGAVKSPPHDEGVLLDAKLVWEQSTQILDFVLPAPQPGSQTILTVLERRRLAFYSQDWTQWQLVRELPAASAVATRDWRGHIDSGQTAGQSDARWPGNECKGDFAHPSTVNCQTPSVSGAGWISGNVRPPFPPAGGGDAVSVGSQCRMHAIALATGGGDWTQPDFVQAYEMSAGAANASASGSPINFDGPVTAIWPGAAPGTARVIVRNLRSGNYEAYIVMATCSQ
ncbi:MAG TPA: hypothetical protein VIY69_18010 [Candidatus Acidoferrales bacterium]